MVLEVIAGVENEVPVPKLIPPVEVLYHFNVPVLAVAARFTLPLSQRVPAVEEVTVGVGTTLAITAVLVDVMHPLSSAST